ncbi:MAG: DUF3619 family protein [Gammaproteobacteria bacterium]|nr:DUF3619 family protein [Gammaproteobacteria bacterium]
MNDSFENKLIALSEKTFNKQLQNIDEDVLQRLRQSRQNAVEVAQMQVKTKSNAITVSFPSWLSPVSTATAFASIALIASSLWIQPVIQAELTASPLEDISMLMTSDEFELYENLDFYIWLEDEDNAS